ncbi:hypothetical protein PI23P_02092 [Polaribacter irgensii 23-P]|uniref:Uncharacterized protein n=1 Tax=Polaribacter irgensii 23-P TaxID=313594 RepID=A4BWA5_9FLAO|nr:hypothetical protein PI23P_02092 [Polaribacter irgensii 23-P]
MSALKWGPKNIKKADNIDSCPSFKNILLFLFTNILKQISLKLYCFKSHKI